MLTAAVVGLVLLLAPAEGTDAGTPLVVFAPASTTNAMESIARAFQADTGVPVNLNFAASSTLARQIAAGAPADTYISAHPQWAEFLIEQGELDPDSCTNLLGNRLVFVTPADRPGQDTIDVAPDFAFADFFSGRLSLADPDHAPAGIYAKQALQKLGWWNAVEQRVVPGANVRAALRLVESGEADLGIVYHSDAVASDQVNVLATIPENLHEPIRYIAGVCTGSAHPQADAFLDYLQEARSHATFERAGFVPLGATNQPAVPDRGRSHEGELSALALSLKVALTCAAVILIPGIAIGWLLARVDFPGRGIVDALVHAPLVMPPVVTGYLALIVLGRRGWIGAWLNDSFGIQLAFSWFGAVIAAGIVAFPLLVRSVRLAINLVDRRLEQAAATLGASPLRVWATVTIPLALPGVLVGLVLAFARSLGEFGATITFAGNIEGRTRTLPLAIYTHLQNPGSDGAAARLVGLSLLLSFAALMISNRIERRAARQVGRA